MDTLSRTSGVRYLRLFKGVDAAAEGAVYPEFLADTHVVDRIPIPPHWRRIRSIDFGYKHPFACQFWAISPDGVMYLYREIYHSLREVPKHAEQIKRLSDGERFEQTITDHDAGQRAQLRTAGIPSILAYKEVLPGIDAVRLRLQEKRIFFFRDATVELDPALKEKAHPQRTVEEFDSYSFEDAKEGKATKEEPKKVMDDGMDCLRYAVAYVDDLARRRFKVRGGRVRGALAGAR
jgi:phage terminase large subunit